MTRMGFSCNAAGDHSLLAEYVKRGEMQDERQCNAETVIFHGEKLQDDLQKLGLKIKHREENLKFLRTQINNLDESIQDLQVSISRYRSLSLAEAGRQNHNHAETEQNHTELILQQEKTAAAVLYQLKTRFEAQSSNSPLTKDVVGVVATLGKVHDDNLSRLLSEYLGLETMLAIVCKTYKGVKALEMYDREGEIDKCAGLHGFGPSIGRPMDGRFLVICLENLRPYVGKFVPGDPQKALALLKPRLPNGDCPPGFLGFAVNMINVDAMNLYCLTTSGHGLRETLFYHLFSRLQVYKSRADMQLAAPCISDGAISLDGGILKRPGTLFLGHRKEVNVRFPVSLGNSYVPVDITETREQIKNMIWEKERIIEDVKREEELLSNAKTSFDFKRQEFMKFLAGSSPCLNQNNLV